MYFEELSIGQSAQSSRTVTQEDINAFAELSGDRNGVHLDAEFAAKTPFKGIIAHGMLSVSFVSAVIGTRLPGPGTIYLDQSMAFLAPVRPGDTVVTTVTVMERREKGRSRGEVVCDTSAKVGDVTVLTGRATLMVPKRDATVAPS